MRILILLTIIFTASAQNVLKLEEAMQIALKKNYDILVQKNNIKISDKEKYWKSLNNFLPFFNTSMGYSTSKFNQTFYQGTTQIASESGTNSSYNNRIGINVTVDNLVGEVLQHIANLKMNKQDKINAISTVQGTIQTVMNNYFDLAYSQQALEVQKKAVETAKEQVNFSESRYNIGTLAKVDVLTQQTSLNNAESSLLTAELTLAQRKATLNLSLGNAPLDDIVVDDNVLIANNYTNYEELENRLINENKNILSSAISLELAEITKQAAFLNMVTPSVRISAGYNKNGNQIPDISENFSRYAKFDQDYSASVSLSLSYSFSYGTILDDQIAELQLNNQKLNDQKLKRDLKRQLSGYFLSYRNAIKQLELQEKNLITNQEDVRLKQERYNLGSGTSLDLRIARDQLVRAELDILNAKFNAKKAELEIERLLGTINIGDF